MYLFQKNITNSTMEKFEGEAKLEYQPYENLLIHCHLIKTIN